MQVSIFLADLAGSGSAADTGTGQPTVARESVDVSDLDTVVVPAQEDGFQEVFLGEHRWYQIRIHASMLPRIKYIAAYRPSPTWRR